jgi:hypothetical protein
MKRKTKKNYKFGDALKEASPLFHAKYGKKGKYDKKGGDPKISGEVITDEEAINAINECTTEKELDAVALRIVYDLLTSAADVRALVEKKRKEFESGQVSVVAEGTEGTVGAEGTVGTGQEGTEGTGQGAEGEGEEGTVPPSIGSKEVTNMNSLLPLEGGGKKSKKSAKKGKKSVKKGGKKARKSAKKSRR